MSQYTSQIMELEAQHNQVQSIKAKVDALIKKLDDMNNQYVVMLEAQQLLTTVSD